MTEISPFRLVDADTDAEFIISSSGQTDLDAMREDIDRRLDENLDRIKNLDAEIGRLTADISTTDIWISAASGVLTGLIDIIYVGEMALDFDAGTDDSTRTRAHETINRFISKVAELEGYKGSDRLGGAIDYLEKDAPVDQDNVWKGLGISSAKLHHLEDIAHHPTPMGLVSALCVTFLRVAVFSDKDGTIHFVGLATSRKELLKTWLPILASSIVYWLSCVASRRLTERELSEQPKWARILVKALASLPAAIQIGKTAHNWAKHLVSDMGGSKNTPGGGMGIPGLILSLLKEMAAIPPFNTTGLNRFISEQYASNKMDLRSELLPVAESLGKQVIPVVLNECIVSVYYFISRLIAQHKLHDGWEGIEWSKVIPYGNRTIARMRTISSGVFMAVDMADAAIRSAMKGSADPSTFLVNMVLRINIVGVGRFVLALGNDISMGLRRAKMRNIRLQARSERLALLNAAVYVKEAGVWTAARDAGIAVQKLTADANRSIAEAAVTWAHVGRQLPEITDNISRLESADPSLADDIDDIL